MQKALRIIASVLVLAICFSAFAVYAEGDKYGKVTANSLYVRSGPNTGYSVRGTVHKGYSFTVGETAQGPTGITWYKISYKDADGWISGKYITTSDTAPTESDDEDEYHLYDEEVKITVTGGTVNVRKGPSTSYAKITRVHYGEVYYADTDTNTAGRRWFRIELDDGRTGWISSRYATPKTVNTNNNDDDYDDDEDSADCDYIKVTGGTVNVRQHAGTGYSKLGTAHKGATYDYLGSARDSNGRVWYHIDYNGDDGWISSAYSKPTDTASSSSKKNSSSYDDDDDYLDPDDIDESGRVKVTGSSVNVRQSAGTGYSSFGKAYKGDRFDYDGFRVVNGTVWYHIDFDGEPGWISGKYAVPIG